jgi:hypothetical protein
MAQPGVDVHKAFPALRELKIFTENPSHKE